MQDNEQGGPSKALRASTEPRESNDPRGGWQGEAPKPIEPRTPPKQQEGPRATFAALKPPSLSVPKGGGALRGIGETFRTNPITGTVAAEIPLPFTQAPRGPTPQLALSYDSGQGNGLFGLGWDVAVPQIVRKTEKRLPEYLDSEESDVFLFGGDDLVPKYVFNTGTSSWDPDVGTGTDGTDQFEVRRFRTRIEGAFSRIERWTHQTTKDVHWRVTSRDNTLSIFGRSSASRVVDPQSAARVFAWLLTEVRDDRGHVVTYTYKQEDNTGVSYAKPSEAHRKGVALLPNRYLKSVTYGNTEMGNAATRKLELVFDYGEHHATAPLPSDASPWLVRDDPFSTYRAGFELRTYRLCRRVLMFHYLEANPAEAKLVRSLDLTYSPPSPKVTQLLSAKVVGYTPNGLGYDAAELPSVTFTYSAAPFTKRIDALPVDEARDFNPAALTKAAQWVDLDGEGLPGVLTDRGRAIAFKRNLGEGHLAPARTLPSAPNLSMQGASAVQLADVAGSGTLSMLRLDPRASGYHERTPDGWGPFRTFASNPNVEWSDPNLRMVDLNGDGFDDILITRGDHLVWLPSLGRDGFGPARHVPLPAEEEKGPRVIFAGRFSSVFLADMSGDGQADIVQVTHSRVCYWPNLGYGRFGARVVMDNCPKIERSDWFHPSRVRLADLDGTGTADLLYFDSDGVHVWPNHSGNGFGVELRNECVPVPDALRTLSIVDLHGCGMSTLVWSPSREPHVPLRYTSPFGTKKPYLLELMTNGMGLEVSFKYEPSTKSFLADKKAGKPWATKLPFPVQVVTKVEAYDAVSKTRSATTYSYHHGHYDTVEREFRGFGRVDQYDAETFDDDAGQGSFADRPIDNGELAQPPVLTRTWFHLGTWRAHDTRDGSALQTAYSAEYWSGDPDGPSSAAHDKLRCDVLGGPQTTPPPVPPDELAEAHRALKGTMLRQEVYGHTRVSEAWQLHPVPFTVTESAYRAVRRQPSLSALGASRPKHAAVFQSLPLETRTHTYDRVETDPRVHQWVAIEHDPAYGDVITALAAAYARRGATPGTEQGRVYALITQTDVAHATTGGYRLSIPIATRSYELTGFAPGTSAPLARDALITKHAAGVAAGIVPYHLAPGAGDKLRLVEHIKIKYRESTTLEPFPNFGDVDARAIAYQSYQLDLTSAHIAQLGLQTTITSALLADARYDELGSGSGDWWIPSGTSTLDPNHFFLPTAFADPFGNVTSLQYDAPFFFVSQITDAKANVVSATYDYRVLAPREIIDPNGNRSQAAFDELGRVVAIAVLGKTTESLGDTLGAPTEAFEYVTDRWTQPTPKPNYAKRTARETHGTSPTPKLQISYVYTDGSGRIALTKAQAEPDDATPTTPRWVGSGKTVLNNKGNPVKQYEPYFAATPEYETEDDLRTVGVTPLITYDAVGRVIKFQNPDETFRTAQYSPWLETAHDENDNAPTPHPHRNTPALTHLDPLGRPYLVQADNGTAGSPAHYDTRTALDIENQPLTVKDPIGRDCQTHVFTMSGRLLVETNIDKGARTLFQDVSGAPLRRWDARGQEFALQYDALRRPTHLWLTASATTKLLERRYYGEAASSPQTENLRGQLILLFDQAGKTELGPFDFKGNLRETHRTLAQNYTSVIDWNATGIELGDEDDPAAAETEAATLLEAETFLEAREYDALNRVTSLTTPDGSVYLPTFNEAGLLDKVDVDIRGTSATTFVRNIAYDAKGRRTKIEHGSATTTKVVTQYSYHPLTFRLTSLVTTRVADAKKLQDLAYTYDRVGNVTAIADAAHQDVFYDDILVSADQAFAYDAIYRLKSATGREHNSLTSGTVIGTDGAPIQNLPDPNDPQAIRRYTEEYDYDQVGNILELSHDGGGGTGTWTRAYTYFTGTNRLDSTTGTGVGAYTHDAHGNMLTLPGVGALGYSPFDQMSHADLGGGGDAYYVYDASGQRVRKVVDTGANLIKERIYLGAYEIYREHVSGNVDLQRDTLHVMDDVTRIAMVETVVVDDGDEVGTPEDLVRVQYTNHLGTAVLECDEDGAVISFEEMHPYGGSAYRSAPSASEVTARRYRYTGKERDEETGLDYFGARYYAPWLGRWTTADPLGLQAGLNLYLYGRGSPLRYNDPSGTEDVDLTGIGESLSPEVGGVLAQRRQMKEAGERATAAAERGWIITSEGHLVTEEMAQEMGASDPNPRTKAEGARRAADRRIQQAYEAVTERPIDTATSAAASTATPISGLIGLGVSAFKATWTALEASDTEDAGKRELMYGEALFGAGEVGFEIASAGAPEVKSSLSGSNIFTSRLGRAVTAPLWGFVGTGGPGSGSGKPAAFGVATTRNYRETFFGSNPLLRGLVVVHHAVEQQVTSKFPGVVTEAEVHSLENLRGIPKGLNSDLHLSKIRKSWNKFYRENPAPTPEQLLEHATKIDREYGTDVPGFSGPPAA